MTDSARDSTNVPGGPPPALVQALRRLLRPLVRLLLRHQATYPFLASQLKSIYVELAEDEFGIPGKAQTTSRVSLLTGIHRKDVKRLRETPVDVEAPPGNVSLGAQLVLRWTASPEYLDEEGHPRALPRLAGDAVSPSFESLVVSVSKDIRARAVLDEWLRLGVARVDERDRVVLVAEAFVPESGFDEKSYFLGRNVHDHLAAAVHNLSGDGPPLLERSVYYANLSPESVDELAALGERVGMEALQAVNRRALELQERDTSRSDSNERMNLGVFFFRDRVDEKGDGGDDA